ncbi:MAG: fumarylacetoacetate hydrolase family protein, partial [Gammaproteobacteria bacterium]|nr:fumarylacetoacetate hydrolase family protein [Gammaproteobacteria bacterium]
PLVPNFSIPQDQGSVHHEAEIALLISKEAKNISADKAWDVVSHITVALDLTLRDVQSRLKENAHPWEIAKGFDGACPLGNWVPVSQINNKDDMAIELIKNGEQKQKGHSTQMITSISDLIAYTSKFFTLQPGDVILTGTPAGVGPLASGDELRAILDDQFTFTTNVL